MSFRNRQNMIKLSTFGSKLVATRIVRNNIIKLRIRCKFIGVLFPGPDDTYCDNQDVMKNTSVPDLTLLKNHNSITYHVVRESSTAGILRLGK